MDNKLQCYCSISEDLCIKAANSKLDLFIYLFKLLLKHIVHVGCKVELPWIYNLLVQHIPQMLS